jgi:hypothetical protein
MKIVLLIVALVALVARETTAIAQPRAEDLYAEGKTAYDRADYAVAIAKWQASYDLSKEAGLLFNLAQARRLAGDCIGAIATYRRFDTEDADSTSDQHKLAKDFLRELEGTCVPQLPIVTTPPRTKPSFEGGSGVPRLNDRESGRGRTWKIAGLVTGGVGIVTITVGLGFGHHGAAIGDEITAACATSCDWATLKDKEARGKREVAIGKALDVVGVAAVAGGAVFYYLGMRQETLTVAPAPGGGVVSWSGSW